MSDIAIYNDHPQNCIVCGEKSYGEPQCNNCLAKSTNFANKLKKKIRYRNNWNRINNLFYKTFTKAANQFNADKRRSLSNKLIGIGLFCNKQYPDKPDKVNEAYQHIDSTIKI